MLNTGNIKIFHHSMFVGDVSLARCIMKVTILEAAEHIYPSSTNFVEVEHIWNDDGMD
jgi:hypothetical protein